MKRVILTTILLLSFLFPASALAESESFSQKVEVSIPPRMELDAASLSNIATSIPLGEEKSVPVEIKLRSNTSWFVKTTTLTSLDNQVQNDTVFTGSSNSDASSQAVDAELKQIASWSDEKNEEALVIYAMSSGF